MTRPDLDALEALAKKAASGDWRACRDGNQYIGDLLVGASRIQALARPWNPRGVRPDDPETARFRDADADFIAAVCPEKTLALLAYVRGLEAKIAAAMEMMPAYLHEEDDPTGVLGALCCPLNEPGHFWKDGCPAFCHETKEKQR